MKKHRHKNRIPSSYRIRVALRLTTLWTSWSLKRAVKKHQRLQKKIPLLQRQVDSLLVQEKQAEQLAQMRLHQLQELKESQLYREQKSLVEMTPEERLEDLQARLGLGL